MIKCVVVFGLGGPNYPNNLLESYQYIRVVFIPQNPSQKRITSFFFLAVIFRSILAKAHSIKVGYSVSILHEEGAYYRFKRQRDRSTQSALLRFV